MSTVVSHRRFVIHPLKFSLWLAIVAMVMMFAAFTSAYVVKKADTRNWTDVVLPNMFTYSTIVILFSSVCMQVAYMSFKRNRIGAFRLFLTITFMAGISFLVMQVLGWREWSQQGVALSTYVSGSFMYVISGAHFLHVFGGVVALLIFTVRAFSKFKKPVDTLVENIHPDKQVGVELLATYWHFVDILWLYLFFFFQLS